jgi:hypothetical protein
MQGIASSPPHSVHRILRDNQSKGHTTDSNGSRRLIKPERPPLDYASYAKHLGSSVPWRPGTRRKYEQRDLAFTNLASHLRPSFIASFLTQNETGTVERKVRSGKPRSRMASPRCGWVE